MAVESRLGSFGEYFGNRKGSSNPLTYAQMCKNAEFIYGYFNKLGWSVNAIAGMLGNMEYESSLNPGRWEGDNPDIGPGYGLVQWTPYTNHTNWCESNGFLDYSTMDANLGHIKYELENNLQYIPTSSYPLTFSEFSKSTETPYYLASVFAWNYERSAVVLWGSASEQEALRQARGSAANRWYTYLTGITPPSGEGGGSTSTKKKKGNYNFILFNRNKRLLWKNKNF